MISFRMAGDWSLFWLQFKTFIKSLLVIQVRSGPRTHSSVFCLGRGICGWISSSDDIPFSVFSTGALLFFFLFTFFSFFFFPPFSPSELPLPPSSPSSLLPFPFFPPFFFFFFFLSSAMAARSPFFLWLHSSFRQAEKMKNYWWKTFQWRRTNEGNGLDLNISLRILWYLCSVLWEHVSHTDK